MRQIELTQGQFALVDDVDFPWLTEWDWYFHSIGYAYNRELGLMHRAIMDMVQGPLQRCNDVHHVDENKLNNQRVNLQVLNRSQHNYLRSGITGVTFVPRLKSKPWKAQIKFNGKQINLGYFSTEEEARQKYNETKLGLKI